MGYGTEMDGCGRFMKYSLFFTNFIIFVSHALLKVQYNIYKYKM